MAAIPLPLREIERSPSPAAKERDGSGPFGPFTNNHTHSGSNRRATQPVLNDWPRLVLHVGLLMYCIANIRANNTYSYILYSYYLVLASSGAFSVERCLWISSTRLSKSDRMAPRTSSLGSLLIRSTIYPDYFHALLIIQVSIFQYPTLNPYKQSYIGSIGEKRILLNSVSMMVLSTGMVYARTQSTLDFPLSSRSFLHNGANYGCLQTIAVICLMKSRTQHLATLTMIHLQRRPIATLPGTWTTKRHREEVDRR